MQFRLLGPVEIDSSGRVTRLPRRRERCLLAVLLLDPHRVIPVDRLAELLWDGEPPDRARRIIHSHVSRLRAALAAGNGVAIGSVGDGYRIDVSPEAVDAHRFYALLDQAANATSPADRAAQLRAALDLWRGRPLADAASEWLRARLCTTLEEHHLTATEDWLATSLELGRSRQVLPELAQLANTHPGRERLVALHMRALHLADRKADALAVYDRARKQLADEFGLDPSPTLRDLHQAVLRDQVTVPTPRATTSDSGPSRHDSLVPRQLPADIPGFTGRGEQLHQLDALLRSDDAGNAVVISAIGGTAGVGKTALAVHWAQHVADRFPDGQLYVNLRGYDPEQPMNPADALARFLTALGVPSQDMPLELDDRAARYRSELADRRMLILLDNAATVEQVRPLLPGTDSCTVVVTSRDRLAGLIAVHGAHRIDLDPLPLDDAVALLRRLIGSRVDDDSSAATVLAEQCARLPLALRVAAELASSRPVSSVTELVTELTDQQRRLELLNAGNDPHAAVAAVFSWSIKRLPTGAAQVFRLLGLHPGPDFDLYAVAALANTSLESACHALELLVRAHLVHSAGTSRYGMHDLLRTFARHCADSELSDRQRDAATDQLLQYYVATAALAMDTWSPADSHRRPKVTMAATPLPAFADADHARAWLDTERPCLVAAAGRAAAGGWYGCATTLSAVLFRYLDNGHYPDALAVHGLACQAASQAGDIAGHAYSLRYLGTTQVQMAEYQQAGDHLHAAVALFREVGDIAGEAAARNMLGVVADRQTNYDVAADHYQLAGVRFRQVNDLHGEAMSLVNLGISEDRRGRLEVAVDYITRSLAIFRELGNQRGEAIALTSLGNVEERLGRYESAANHIGRATAQFRQIGDRQGCGRALDSLAIVQLRIGQPGQARESAGQALSLLQEIDDRLGQAWAHNSLAEAAYAAGNAARAVADHDQALAIATEVGARDQQARAHAGLGNAYRSLGHVTRASAHYDYALAIYGDLGMSEADDVRTRIAALSLSSGLRAHDQSP